MAEKSTMKQVITKMSGPGTPILATLLLLLSLGAAQSQQAVVPGGFPASIHLGIPRQDVWKHIGKPTVTHFLHLANATYTCDNWYTSHFEWRAISRRGRIVQLDYRCVNTRPGPTFADFHHQHPRVQVKIYRPRDEVGATMVADDVSHGIAWTLYVHHRDDPGINILGQISPLRIIRHRPGVAILPDVSEILNENDPLRHDFSVWFAAGASRG
jgi:hypothetical protein